MKLLKNVLSVLCLLAFSAFADDSQYDFYFADPGIPFTYVRVSAFTDGTYNPVAVDGGWYNGFQGAEGYVSWYPGEGPFLQYDGFVTGSYAMDPTNKAGYWFVMELLSEDFQVVGYSGYADYGTIQLAEQGSYGHDYWSVQGMKAAPIPEPTSGLLLLLGGALLGLRRKRRAA